MFAAEIDREICSKSIKINEQTADYSGTFIRSVSTRRKVVSEYTISLTGLSGNRLSFGKQQVRYNLFSVETEYSCNVGYVVEKKGSLYSMGNTVIHINYLGDGMDTSIKDHKQEIKNIELTNVVGMEAAILASPGETFNWPVEVNELELRRLVTFLELEQDSARMDESTYKYNTRAAEIAYGKNILSVLDNGVLNQTAYRNTFGGRITFKGLNLQSSPKNIRSAALFGHVQIDVSVSSYFHLLAEAKHIARYLMNVYMQDAIKNNKYSNEEAYAYKESGTIPATVVNEFMGTFIGTPIPGHGQNMLSYEILLSNKEKVRVDILNDMLDTRYDYTDEHKLYKQESAYYKIKTALTAIGFGAKAAAGQVYIDVDGKIQTGAMSDIFKSPELAKKFSECKYVKYITGALNEITNLIFDYHWLLSEDGNKPLGEIIPGFPYLPNVDASGVPIYSKSRIIAHIYQSLESKALLDVYNIYGNDHNKLVIPVHDCVIVKNYVENDLAAITTGFSYIDHTNPANTFTAHCEKTICSTTIGYQNKIENELKEQLKHENDIKIEAIEAKRNGYLESTTLTTAQKELNSAVLTIMKNSSFPENSTAWIVERDKMGYTTDGLGTRRGNNDRNI